MPVVQDDLWKNPGNPGMIVVSAHSYLNQDGRLFLGYGKAKEAIQRIPQIEAQCGQVVRQQAVDGVYGFLPIRPFRPQERIVGFGLFQTRFRWDEAPDLDLIRYSMECLRNFVHENDSVKIRMNYPGIGNPGLTVEAVATILVPVPPTVTVCHEGEIRQSIPEDFVGFKSIYIQVEGMLQDGRYNQAVDYLMNQGFDIQSAMEQVNAVQRVLRERSEREAKQMERWRSSSYFG